MKVIGVVGSPRHGKNTATLVQKVLEGAENKGLETDLFYISDYDISPCRACNACKQTGECVQDDDMKVFYEAIGQAKVLVLGTPIYFDHVSAQTKIFLDRLYSYLHPNLAHRFPKGVKGEGGQNNEKNTLGLDFYFNHANLCSFIMGIRRRL